MAEHEAAKAAAMIDLPRLADDVRPTLSPVVGTYLAALEAAVQSVTDTSTPPAAWMAELEARRASMSSMSNTSAFRNDERTAFSFADSSCSQVKSAVPAVIDLLSDRREDSQGLAQR